MMEPRHEKREIAERWLAHGTIVVMVDAAQPGVAVPEEHRGNRHLLLRFSRRFDTQPELDALGIGQRLTFGKVPFAVDVPWDAVLGIGSEALRLARDFSPFFANLPGVVRGIAGEGLANGLPSSTVDGGGEASPPREGHLRLVR